MSRASVKRIWSRTKINVASKNKENCGRKRKDLN